MSSRAHREAVVRRERELLSRGAMSDEEEAAFASQQAAQDRAAWLRRHPEIAAPELPLENGRESRQPNAAPSTAPDLQRAA